MRERASIPGGRRGRGGSAYAGGLLCLALLTCGCPYEASFLPAGDPVPLHADLVGVWECSLDDDAWAEVRIGWARGPSYLVWARAAASETASLDPHEETTGTFDVFPREVGGREIWSWRWPDESGTLDATYTF